MAITEDLEQGRAAFARRAWGEAFERLRAAEAAGATEPGDLELLAIAGYLIGDQAASTDAWARAFKARNEAGDLPRASRCAFWLAFALLNRGEWARGGGWLARASELLDEHGQECTERGYLMVPAGLQQLMSGNAEQARATFDEAIEMGRRFRDPDLLALGRLGAGQTRITLGEVAAGVALLDEVMVSVTADETSSLVGGVIYCGVIDACQEVFDLRRATEWTNALNVWCEAQPDLVPYRGQCLVHRSQIMLLHGDWPRALDEARRAREHLSDPPGPAVGEAWYQLGELHRLRGDHAEAEEAYVEGNRWGRVPQPGLALLRLAQGKREASAVAIRLALEEAADPPARSRLLPAVVEIMLAVGDRAAARAATDELTALAASFESPLLSALASRAAAVVLLAEGDARTAAAALRATVKAWQELDAPYEAARTKVLLAQACRALGDADSAEMEVAAARLVFQQVGAAPDLAALVPAGEMSAPGGLTPREVEVLKLIAGGGTNRAIAEKLVISEKTVARHVSNIFTKLSVGSRAAATAYAYEHDLV